MELPAIEVWDIGGAAGPERFRFAVEGDLFPRVCTRGDRAILERPLLALFCSIRCPGDIILKAFDTARALRDGGVAVVGGFHSPMEKECLDILLRGSQPVVVCVSRDLAKMRVPEKWRKPLAEGRLLLVSQEAGKIRRLTAELAERRNRFITALADRVLVAYAEPGGKTERLCRELLAEGKPVFVLPSEANGHLVAMGAREFRVE